MSIESQYRMDLTADELAVLRKLLEQGNGPFSIAEIVVSLKEKIREAKPAPLEVVVDNTQSR